MEIQSIISLVLCSICYEILLNQNYTIYFLRPGQEGRDSKGGREKRKFCIDLGGCCSVSFGRAISQVAVKNNVQPHISRGKPIVTSARLGHTFGQSRK